MNVNRVNVDRGGSYVGSDSLRVAASAPGSSYPFPMHGVCRGGVYVCMYVCVCMYVVVGDGGEEEEEKVVWDVAARLFASIFLLLGCEQR